MDEIETKLKKGDSQFACDGISKLIESIQKRAISGDIQGKEISELKLLKEKCTDPNPITSFTALVGFLKLVECGILDISPTISIMISFLPSVSNYCGVIHVTGKLLELEILEKYFKNNQEYESSYNISSPQHPFVTILKHNSDCWQDVFITIENVFLQTDEMIVKNRVKMLRPVFLFIFCEPVSTYNSFGCKSHLLSLLMQHIEDPNVKNQVLEMLSWLQLDMSSCYLYKEVFTSTFNFWKKYDVEKNHFYTTYYEQLLIALTPCIALCVKWLVNNGHSPIMWLKLLEDTIELCQHSADIVAYLLADALGQCPSLYLKYIIELCEQMINKNLCSELFSHTIAASLMSWLMFPSLLTADSFQSTANLVSQITQCDEKWTERNFRLLGNTSFHVLQNSHVDIHFAASCLKIGDSMMTSNNAAVEWLKNNAVSLNIILLKKFYLLICGILLTTSDFHVSDLCIKYFIRLIKKDAQMTSSVLSVLLYKLSKEVEPKMQMHYLLAVTQMAVEKEHVPLIISTIALITSSSSRVAQSFGVQLYLSLWKAENRTYPYLYKMLISSSPGGEEGWEIDIAKTSAMKEICTSKPELHGKELVKQLSQILNTYGNSSSGLPSALAIDAITELCKAHVIDIAGTWRALQPKLGKDKRPEVVTSLCNMFSEIPKLRTTDAEYEKLIHDVLSKLWWYITFDDSACVKASLRTLGKFKTEDYTLKSIPEVYRRGIRLPQEYAKTPVEAARKPEDVLPYVPGECWIQVLQKIKYDVLVETADMLIVLLEEEVNTFPKGIFHLPSGKPEPSNYSNLPHRSICRALIDYLQKTLKELNTGDPLAQPVYQVLRILSHTYAKSFPPLSWAFLQKFSEIDSKCKEYCLRIASKQGKTSRSAREVAEALLTSFTASMCDTEIDNIQTVYTMLPDLCNSIPPNILRKFIEVCYKIALDLTLNSASNELFETLMKLTQSTLKDKNIHDANRNLLIVQVESLLEQIPPQHIIFSSYASCVTELPMKIIERMSSPSVWWEVTARKLHQSLSIRSAIALREESTAPLVWLNECIDAASTFPQEHMTVLRSFTAVIMKCRRNANNCKWLLELMGRIQQTMSSDEPTVDSLTTLEWTHRIASWKKTPLPYSRAFYQSLIALKEQKHFKEYKNWTRSIFVPHGVSVGN